MTKREQRHLQVIALKATGMTFKEVAAHLGLAKSTVTAAYYDPTGEQDRVRKARRYGTCVDCGARTFNGGAKTVPERCAECAIANSRELDSRRVAFLRNNAKQNRRYSDEELLDIVRRYQTMNGVKEARERGERLPTIRCFTLRFGSWNEARAAAGLPVHHRRPYRGSLTREGALLAVEDCAADLGRLPSYREYMGWRLARGKDAPSASHVRGLFDNSWMAVTDALLASRGDEQVAA